MCSAKLPLHLLIVEDSEDDAFFVVRTLTRGGFEIDFKRVETSAEMRQALEGQSWDAVISDYQMPTFDGLAALRIYEEFGLDIPFIVVSGAIGEETAVMVMKAGAHDYILKGNLTRLVPAIERELEETRLRQERSEALQELEHSESRYRAIVEDQTELINRCTLDGTITFVNYAYAHLQECTPEELIGKKFCDFLTEGSVEHLEQIRSALTKKQPVSTNVSSHEKKDGSILWIQWRDRLIFDADGNPMEYQGVGRDITEQRQAEDDLKRFAANLERRAVQLQVAAEIARDATSIRELGDLLYRAVNLARDRFGYYYVGVFLVDEKEEYAVLTSATGEAGQKLVEMEHKLKIGERGIVGYVAGAGLPHIVSDVDDDPIHFAQPLLPETRSEMAIPLKIGERLIGVLDVQSIQESAFDDQDLQILQTLADQLAIAVETARLFEAERAQLLLARTLQEVGMLLTSELGVDEVLEQILDLLGRVVKYDSVTVQLMEAEEQLYFAAGRGFDDLEKIDHLVRKLSSHNLDVYKKSQGRARVVADTVLDESWVALPEIDYIRSWIGAPLLARGKLIGFLTVDSRTPNAYSEDVAATVMTFASQAAIAIENAQLFESERAARERAEALRKAVQVISSTLSLNQVIQVILEQLARVLVYDTGSIILIEGNRAIVQAGYGYESIPGAARLSEIEFDMSVETVRHIIDEEQPLMIPDVREDERWVDTAMTGQVRSWMGLPLQVRDQVIGIISLERYTPGGFSDDEIALVQIFATHTSTAIENARLFETEEKRARELETLRKVSLGLTASLEPDAVLSTILEGIYKLMPEVGNAHIFIYDNDELTFGQALWRDGTDDKSFSELRSDGLTYTVARTGDMLIVPNMATHPIFEGVASEKGWTGAIIGLPLKIGERVIGVINIAYQEPRTFSQDELGILRLLGDQAALAIENAHSYQDVDRLVSLLASEQYRLEGLIEMLPVGVLLLDEEHNLLVTLRLTLL